jgi:hypothetical protein
LLIHSLSSFLEVIIPGAAQAEDNIIIVIIIIKVALSFWETIDESLLVSC